MVLKETWNNEPYARAYAERFRQRELQIADPDSIHAAMAHFIKVVNDIKSGELQYGSQSDHFRPPRGYAPPVTRAKVEPFDNGYYGDWNKDLDGLRSIIGY